MKKTIPTISKYILLCCSLWLYTTAAAQLKKFPAIFPAIPFDVNKAVAEGNMKCIVWRGIYNMADGDESGYIWSSPIEESFQYQRYTFPDGNMDLISSYVSSGDKAWTMEVFYKQGYLSAIEKLSYDSLQESSLDRAYNYFYKGDGYPFQRVTLFGHPNKAVRLLDEFVFDTLNRVIRQKTTAVGNSPDMDSLVGLMDKEKFLILTEYGDTTLARRVYKNLHVLLEDSKIFYNEEGRAGMEEIRNADGEIIITVHYEYEGGYLSKKTHWVTNKVKAKKAAEEEETEKKKSPKKKKKKKNKEEEQVETVKDQEQIADPKPTIYKLEYFTYAENGLMEMHIIEESDIQTIYEYTFFEE
jgi:hypothetical protein